MKFPRRTFLHLAVGAAALPAVPPHCTGRKPIRHGWCASSSAFPAGGATDIPGAPDGSMAVGSPRPAIHH